MLGPSVSVKGRTAGEIKNDFSRRAGPAGRILGGGDSIQPRGAPSYRALSAALRPSPGGARRRAWQPSTAWLSRSVPWPVGRRVTVPPWVGGCGGSTGEDKWERACERARDRKSHAPSWQGTDRRDVSAASDDPTAMVLVVELGRDYLLRYSGPTDHADRETALMYGDQPQPRPNRRARYARRRLTVTSGPLPKVRTSGTCTIFVLMASSSDN